MDAIHIQTHTENGIQEEIYMNVCLQQLSELRHILNKY